MKMSSPNDRVGEYSRVNDEENSFETEEDFFVPESEKTRRKRGQGKLWKTFKWLMWVGQALLLAANIYGFTIIMRTVDHDSLISRLSSPFFSRR